MESKRNETFVMIFLGRKANQETWSGSLDLREATTREEVAPRTLTGPTELHRRTSFAYIYTYTLETSGRATKPLFHRRNLLYP